MDIIVKRGESKNAEIGITRKTTTKKTKKKTNTAVSKMFINTEVKSEKCSDNNEQEISNLKNSNFEKHLKGEILEKDMKNEKRSELPQNIVPKKEIENESIGVKYKKRCLIKKAIKTEKIVKKNSRNNKYVRDKETKFHDLRKETERVIDSSKSCASSSVFDINIPVIGKNIIFDSSDEPFKERYDLAIERNRKRAISEKEVGSDIPNISYCDWKEKQCSRSDVEKETDLAVERRRVLAIAYYIAKIGERILNLLLKDTINEKRISEFLKKFLDGPVNPASMLYVPHFIHAVMFIRGNKDFSRKLRIIADECFQKCHSMLPVPLGYNFETVYTSEVIKFFPDSSDRLDSIPLEYDDISEVDFETTKESEVASRSL